MNKFYFLILSLLFIFNSCGGDDTNPSNERTFSGKWQLIEYSSDGIQEDLSDFYNYIEISDDGNKSTRYEGEYSSSPCRARTVNYFFLDELDNSSSKFDGNEVTITWTYNDELSGNETTEIQKYKKVDEIFEGCITENDFRLASNSWVIESREMNGTVSIYEDSIDGFVFFLNDDYRNYIDAEPKTGTWETLNDDTLILRSSGESDKTYEYTFSNEKLILTYQKNNSTVTDTFIVDR